MSNFSKKTWEQIHSIFYPRSIAVVGANKVKGTVPSDIFYNILKADFQGILYPVSPKEQFIASVKSYKYVVDIPDAVDIAILVFPSSVCHMAMEQCGQKGIKSMIIISAGFKEVGGAGIDRENQIKDIAKKYGISFIGPNCLGVINTDPNCMMNASFAREMPDAGSIGFISQSGALCTAVLDYARAKHIGFSKFVSFGNKADINEIDLLMYLKNDPQTKVILMYLEEVSDGQALMGIAQEIISETGKPILVLKSGRTSEGASAAASHTGALAGSDEVCDAAFEQAGIIRCENIEEMFNYAIAFAYQPLPQSNRVAIITNAGGPGVLATDMAIKSGLELAKFSEETTKALKKSLPVTANIKNPVDVIGDARADRYVTSLTSILKDKSVDGAMVILTPQSMTDIVNIADEISKIAKESPKPFLTSFMGASDVAAGIDIIQKRNIPHYQLPEDMCKSFAAAYNFKKRLGTKISPLEIFEDVDSKTAKSILKKAASEGRKFLTEEEGIKILDSYKLPVLPNGLAKSEDEAAMIAEKIGFPVVLKIMSEDIVHKFDVGGVRLNLNSIEEVRTAYGEMMRNVKAAMPEARIKGILVQKMVKGGEEVIIGLKRDYTFGPVIMFGLGGIFVEVLKDVKFRVVPVAKETIYEMIREIKSYHLLTGARGRSKKDIDSVVNCIQRISQLAVDCPQIKELDINPLLVQDEGGGCFVTDTKIML
ncbi:MAG: acetate--CoA ligase family protein [Bacteroidetes bacterium]|nr:acetate--CoA ligase family protein [Bacteroidota bacterium]